MNTPSPRLVDPVHFFNSCGVSILTAQDQSEQLKAKDREIEELKRKLGSAANRLRALGENTLDK